MLKSMYLPPESEKLYPYFHCYITSDDKKSEMYENGVKKGLDNQAIGLLPLLLFMFLDNYFSYLLSFVIGITFCFVCIFLFTFLSKDKIYIFMLLPSAVTLILYSLFLSLKIEPVLYKYSPLITEVLLVMTLTITGFFRGYIHRRIRRAHINAFLRTRLRTQLNEFFFIAQIVQNVYTLHLFFILIYGVIMFESQAEGPGTFVVREMNLIIGVVVIGYEHIRLSLMHGSLKKETWLPVLDNKQRVTGCIARSVSRSTRKKYFHPIVRIALLYDGMLYLEKRDKNEYVDPGLLDYPFHRYVLFRHTLEDTVKEIQEAEGIPASAPPRYLIKYVYEDDKVKHLVSLYVVCIRSEEELNRLVQKDGKEGKLWTSKQIEENLEKGIFSSYFEKEFPYLQNTILLAEQYNSQN